MAISSEFNKDLTVIEISIPFSFIGYCCTLIFCFICKSYVYPRIRTRIALKLTLTRESSIFISLDLSSSGRISYIISAIWASFCRVIIIDP